MTRRILPKTLGHGLKLADVDKFVKICEPCALGKLIAHPSMLKVLDEFPTLF